MEWDESSSGSSRQPTAVRIADLRHAIATEMETLRRQLQIVEEERQSLRSFNTTMPRERQSGYFLRALLRVGGDELQNARKRYVELDERLQKLMAEIDQHNGDIDALSFLAGLFRRRPMIERAEQLSRQREQILKEHADARLAIERLVRKLSRPESVQEAALLAGDLQTRYREAANTRRYLKIRQRLLQDDIDLYEETDRLLSLLDEHLEIDVSDGELSRLLRDSGFKSRLHGLVGE